MDRLNRIVYLLIFINFILFAIIIMDMETDYDPRTPGTVQHGRFRIEPEGLSRISFGINESFLQSYRIDIQISASEGSIIRLIVLDGDSWNAINNYYEEVTTSGQTWTNDIFRKFIYTNQSNNLNYFRFRILNNENRFTKFTNTTRSVIDRISGQYIDFYFSNDNSKEIEIKIIFNFNEFNNINFSGLFLLLSICLLTLSLIIAGIIIIRKIKTNEEFKEGENIDYFKQQITRIPKTLCLPVYWKIIKKNRSNRNSEVDELDDDTSSSIIKGNEELIKEKNKELHHVDLVEYIERWQESHNIKVVHKFIFLVVPLFLSGLFFIYMLTEMGTITLDYIKVLFSGTKDEKMFYASKTVIPFELDLLSQLVLVFLIFSLAPLFILFTYFGIKNGLKQLGYIDKPKKSLIRLKNIIDGFYKIDDSSDPSNEPTGEVLAKRYISYDNNTKTFQLKAVDPDWELETILNGFLTTFDYFSFFGLVTSLASLFLLSIFSLFNVHFFSLTTNSNIFDLAFLSHSLVYGYMPVVVLVCYPVLFLSHYLITHVKDSLIYYKTRKYLLNEISEQILNLSTEETYHFDMKSESLREIDRKLDLNSASLTYQSLKGSPMFPFFSRIIQFVKYLSLISVITYLYSILVL